VFQTNQTDTGNSETIVHFWSKEIWQMALHNFGIDTKVCKDTTTNDALDCW